MQSTPVTHSEQSLGSLGKTDQRLFARSSQARPKIPRFLICYLQHIGDETAIETLSSLAYQTDQVVARGCKSIQQQSSPRIFNDNFPLGRRALYFALVLLTGMEASYRALLCTYDCPNRYANELSILVVSVIFCGTGSTLRSKP